MSRLFGDFRSFAFLVFSTAVFLATQQMTSAAPAAAAVKATIVAVEGDLRHLDQPGKELFTLVQHYPTLDFPEHAYLRHRSGYPVGVQNNFLVSFEAVLTVAAAGEYELQVQSDDGFRLSIDERPVGEYLFFRAMATQNYTVRLAPGPHRVRLEYFQRHGPAGVRLLYRPRPAEGESMPEFIPVGDDSAAVHFVQVR